MAGGRPTIYSQEIANQICARLANGESLVNICLSKGMPEARTVHYWLIDGKHEEFFLKYARARDIQAEVMFDEILNIADKSDEIVKSGAEKKSSAFSQNQRLKVDTRKWYLSKVLPKKFGDKLDLTTDGKALPTPIYGGVSKLDAISEHHSDEKDIPAA